MAFNIGANSMFQKSALDTRQEVDRPAAVARMLRAIAPDVVCLNEVSHPRTYAAAGAVFDATLPLGGTTRWQTFGGHDTGIVSRYPLSRRRYVTADFGTGLRSHAMALVDLPGAGADLLLICVHMPSRGGENVAARRRDYPRDS